MALVIRVSKTELPKIQALKDHVSELCAAVTETEDDHIYVPMSGKLLDMVKLLYQHNITYVLQVKAQDPTSR